MSLIDIILGQKIILITIGVVILLMLAAVVVMIVPRIRRRRARIAAQKAEQAAIAAAAAEEAKAVKRARKQAIAAARAAQASPDGDGTNPIKPGSAAPAASTPTATPVAAAKPAAAPLISTGTAENKEEEVSPAMQDILSSVFGDEDNAERQAALMRGYDEVDISHLAMLGKQVAAQIRGEKSVTVVESEEL